MTQEFIKAVKERNLTMVRMMLSNELLFDPRGETFSQMLKYANQNLSNLFEENTPSKFDIPSDKNLWDDELVSKVKRDLNFNFSIEKLALFEEMAKWVGRDKANQLEEEEKKERNNKNDEAKLQEPIMSKTHRSSRKTSGTIVTGSGAILAITGICFKSTLLTFVGGIIAIGGVILLTIPNNKK